MINHFRPHVPNCCKMWFPMTETGGGKITDVAGGVVMTPAAMSHAVDNAVQLTIGTPHALSAGSNSATPTLGTLPTIGTKSFILFGVQRLSNDLARPNSYFGFKTSAYDYVGVYDGDGAGIRATTPSNVIVADTETTAGQEWGGGPYDVANGIIRDGNALGDWCHPETAAAAAPGQLLSVVDGDVYARVCRNAGYDTGTPGTYGNWSRNDYAIPDAVVESWQDPNDGSLRIKNFTCGIGDISFTGDTGLPGVWVYIDPAYSVGTLAEFMVGNTGIAGLNDYYGIALFVFDNGLPPDFKEALRWMKAQWAAGNKVIWPGWADL